MPENLRELQPGNRIVYISTNTHSNPRIFPASPPDPLTFKGLSAPSLWT